MANGASVVKSTEVRPEKLVEAISAIFICGLVAIALLIGVMKAVAGFGIPILLAVTVFSFLLMLMVEGALIGLLLKGKRVAKGASDPTQLKGRTTKEFGEAQARVLPEPVSSVTEHTTRAFEPVYSERKSK